MQARISGEHTAMHRMIMGLVKGDKQQVDHINRNKLDNRLKNLRFCTGSENRCNSKMPKTNKTGEKGVCLGNKNNYRAIFGFGGKQYYLGTFDTVQEAKKVRDTFAKKYHKKFFRE